MRISSIYSKAFRSVAAKARRKKSGKPNIFKRQKRQIKDERIERLTANATEAEKKLAQLLETAGIVAKFQSPVGPYIADFLVKPQRCVIEADGLYHEWRKAYDERRDEYMWKQGFTVLRFSNFAILQTPEAVISVIRERLAKLGRKNGK